MKYEIVTLNPKTIAGPGTRTSNTAPDMQSAIGGLWQRLYGEGLHGSLPGRIGANSYGVYTNYESDDTGAYDVVAGVEITDAAAVPAGLACVEIPAGRYAKFSFVVDMQSGDMAGAWQEIWNAGLDRAYTADFEEYLPSEDMSRAPMNVYISLK